MLTDADRPVNLTGGPEDDEEFALGIRGGSDSESSMSVDGSTHDIDMDLDNGE
jgi:hypothetical protein